MTNQSRSGGFQADRQVEPPIDPEVNDMSEKRYAAAMRAAQAPLRTKPSNYPQPYASRMAGREKRPLGDFFGLTNFGVNLTRLPPSAVSALRHSHPKLNPHTTGCADGIFSPWRHREIVHLSDSA